MIALLAEATKLIPGAPEWLSSKVLLCGAAAIGLFFLSFLLRGLQKLASLACAVALIVGVCWFLADAWRNKEKFLSPSVSAQLDSLADKTLRSPQAQAAWESAKAQFSKLTSGSKNEPLSNEDRETAIAEDLTARASALRKEGHAAAAEELLRMRDQVRRRGK